MALSKLTVRWGEGPHFLSASPEKETVQTGTGGQVLLVDDEPLLLNINSRRLIQLGYQVVKTESGTKALDLFIEDPNRFDLLITDQTMPGLTGEDLVREVLQHQPSLPVIVCTEFAEIFLISCEGGLHDKTCVAL